jgi:photosystem II stability/assembly factor-like uncharacterized protein
MGLAIARSDPDIVYALVEAERNALLRSTDGGKSWAVVSDEEGVNPRPFYYADIRVDPLNENRIYRLASSIDVSEDGGRSFRTVVPSAVIHGDVHELWIHPEDPRFMIMGNDGGIAFTHNRGGSWRFVENLPLAQFYHINVDMEIPFNVYGGLQDNGSWFGPSQVWEDSGILNAHWRRTGGGDGFASFPDFSRPRFGYSMSQQGSLMRFDKVTGERRDIQPVAPDGVRLRFNWNAALNVDPHDSTTIYLGSQFVHRSRDGGLSWETISPDLTTDDPEKQRQDQSGGLTLDATGAENHTTILSIAPSPLADGTIWVTTDDGNVQLSRDAGGSWTNLRPRIRGVPEGTGAPHVEPSRHHAGTAYVVFEDHQRGNWTPYLYRTRDFGDSWEALPTEGLRGFLHVVEEDPFEPDLLFAGTEFGLFVSMDGGNEWMPWRAGVPSTPVRALMVHPRDADLVIGTHGRAVLILDDVRPLRALSADPSLSSSIVHIFDPPPAFQVTTAERIGYRSTGHALFFGENRPSGALISLWVGEGVESSTATVEILDLDGVKIRSLREPVAPGLNRFTWDLRMASPSSGAGSFGPRGALVLPGEYRIRTEVDGEVAEARLLVLEDPRMEIPGERRRAKIEALGEAGAWMALSGEAERRLEEGHTAVEEVLDRMVGEENAELKAVGEAVRGRLEETLQRLFTGPPCQGICGGSPVAAPIRQALSMLGSTPDEPSPNDRVAMDVAREALRVVIREVNALFDGDVAEFRRLLLEAGYTPFPASDPLVMRTPD